MRKMKRQIWGAMNKVLFKSLLVAFFILGNALLASAQVKVVDAESGNPVGYASVFDDATGKVLGITSSEGFLPSGAESCKTICVQHINYEPVTMALASVQDNTIKLTARENYQVKEVVIDKAKHDYVRLKVYSRQYTVLNGMIAEVAEGVGYGFFDAESKKYKEGQTLTMRHCRNEDAFKGQKMMMQVFAECNGLSFGGKVMNSINFYDKYNDGKRHTKYDSKGVKRATYFVRKDNDAKRIELCVDSGFVEKPFNFWLLGVSVSNVYTTATFSSAYGKPSLSTWQNVFSTSRYTHNKSKTSVNVYREKYVLEVDFADKADYKALKKEMKEKEKAGTLEKFVRPEGFPPFNKYVTDAMKYMKVLRE